MRTLTNLVIIAASAIGLSACCSAPDSDSLSVPLKGQETDMWCWAASGQMTMNFVNPPSNVTQCDQATKQSFPPTGPAPLNCCANPVPGGCVLGAFPQYDKFGFTAARTSGAALPWNDLRAQIHCAKKPFAFSWHWSSGGTTLGQGGHMMVATGYRMIDSVAWVDVNNPAWSDTSSGPGYAEIISYESYVGGSSWDHTHWDDFYDITFAR